jgi:hypothetical protein
MNPPPVARYQCVNPAAVTSGLLSDTAVVRALGPGQRVQVGLPSHSHGLW